MPSIKPIVAFAAASALVAAGATLPAQAKKPAKRAPTTVVAVNPPQAIERGAATPLTFQVRGKHKGKRTVVLQVRKPNGKWKRALKGTSTRQGRVTFTVEASREGKRLYRARVWRTPQARKAVSKPLRVTVLSPVPVPEPTEPPAPSPDPTPTPDPTPEPDPLEVEGWELTFNDDFNSLDPQVWNVKNGTYMDHEDSHLWARNVSTADGVLRIQAKQETTTVGRTTRAYTSGYVETNGKFSVPNYFRAEIRARVPLEQGMWAAPLWFRPADGSGGEIDLIETYGNRPTDYNHTIHTAYGAGRQQKHIGGKFKTDPLAWHVYTIEKTPGQIKMWVDGEHTATFKSGDPVWYDRYYEAGKRWNFRTNLQVGGVWGGLPDSTTDWTPSKTAMEVDYLRAWVPEA